MFENPEKAPNNEETEQAEKSLPENKNEDAESKVDNPVSLDKNVRQMSDEELKAAEEGAEKLSLEEDDKGFNPYDSAAA